MVEIFETIMQYPLQFLAGLGISGGTIYGVFSFIRWIVSCATKKSQKAREVLNRQAIADMVINAFGGVEKFTDSVANRVIEKISSCSVVNDLKTSLQQAANADNCPIELRAYIETILSQSGSEQLSLIYEQTKATLIEAAKSTTKEIVQNGETIIEQEKQSQEKSEAEDAQPGEEANTKNQSETPQKEDAIDYV